MSRLMSHQGVIFLMVWYLQRGFAADKCNVYLLNIIFNNKEKIILH